MLLSLALAVALVPAAAAELKDEDVFRAMGAEIQRTLTRLKSEGFQAPYFAAYRLTTQERLNIAASWGALNHESADAGRTLYAEIRVGDRTFDNVDLSYHGWHSGAGSSPEALRQTLWALSDRAYRSAVSGLLEKKAKRATEFIAEPLDDFSVEEATRSARTSAVPPWDRERAAEAARAASRVFAEFPHVYDAQASVSLSRVRRLLLTSEGTRIAGDAVNVPGALRLTATTRAPDGMRLDNQRAWPIRSLDELPAAAVIADAARVLARELDALRAAPVQAPTAAPAILDGEATGVLFHEALGHKLEGQRQRDPAQSQLFKDLVGRRIIPESISLWDDPTLASFAGQPLNGHYEHDAEGVPARRVALVERGVLRNFLMSRWPVKGFPRSNGHGRSDAYRHPTGRMAVLIVSAEGAAPRAELERRLLELCRAAGKPHGFLLVGSYGGENPTLRGSAQTLEVVPRLVYRVDAKTGAKTLVRGVKMVGTPLVVLNRIVAAGDDPALGNAFTCGAESGSVPVSQIAPSVLISEVELQRLPEDRLLPPTLPSPLHEKEGRNGR